jgi:hypothetical protein
VQNLTLDLPVGGVAGDVASALVSQLGLLRQNDGVTVNFVVFTPTTPAINLTSTDPNILGAPLTLFNPGESGITWLAIELAAVGTSALPPVIRLSAGHQEFAGPTGSSFVRVANFGSQTITGAAPFTDVIFASGIQAGTLPGWDTVGNTTFTSQTDSTYGIWWSPRIEATAGQGDWTLGFQTGGSNAVQILDQDDTTNDFRRVLSATVFLSAGGTLRCQAGFISERDIQALNQLEIHRLN